MAPSFDSGDDFIWIGGPEERFGVFVGFCQEDIASIYKRLNHTGASINTLSEGLINKLHIGLKGTMNALFLKDLALKIKRGPEGGVRKGKSAWVGMPMAMAMTWSKKSTLMESLFAETGVLTRRKPLSGAVDQGPGA